MDTVQKERHKQGLAAARGSSWQGQGAAQRAGLDSGLRGSPCLKLKHMGQLQQQQSAAVATEAVLAAVLGACCCNVPAWLSCTYAVLSRLPLSDCGCKRQERQVYLPCFCCWCEAAVCTPVMPRVTLQHQHPDLCHTHTQPQLRCNFSWSRLASIAPIASGDRATTQQQQNTHSVRQQQQHYKKSSTRTQGM